MQNQQDRSQNRTGGLGYLCCGVYCAKDRDCGVNVMKKEKIIEIRKWVITLIEILVIAAVIYGIVVGSQSIGFSEGVYAKGYIICQPGDYVNVRWSPKVAHNECGQLIAGDEILLDGETKNGFALCDDAISETGTAWVYTGYIVFDEPKNLHGQTAIVSSNYRLAARTSCTGEVRKWLHNGDVVQVFWWSEEWCVTNYGFVKTQYIDLVGE